MNKRLFFLVSLFLVGCTKFGTYVSKSCVGDKDAFIVSMEDVELLALKNKGDREVVKIEPYTRDCDTLFFLVTFSDGWMVINTDKREYPFLASSMTGKMDIDDLYNQKSLAVWIMQQCLKSIKVKGQDSLGEGNLDFWGHLTGKRLDKRMINTKSLDTVDYYVNSGWLKVFQATDISTYNTNEIQHIIQTKWGQETPWNKRCFVCMGTDTTFLSVGCVPVAVSQVLYYMHSHLGSPSGLYHSINLNLYYDSYCGGCIANAVKSDYTDPSPRWNLMPTDSSGLNTSYVADLMADVGERVFTVYTPLYSLSQLDYNYGSLFGSFGLSCSKVSYDVSGIISQLQNGNPVIITAYNISNSNDGHTWIIDGYHQRRYLYTDYYRWEEVNDYINPADLPLGTEYYSDLDAYQLDPYLYNGKITTESYSSLIGSYWKMNWGYNGLYDSGEYYTGASSIWTSDLSYQDKRDVYYVTEINY